MVECICCSALALGVAGATIFWIRHVGFRPRQWRFCRLLNLISDDKHYTEQVFESIKFSVVPLGAVATAYFATSRLSRAGWFNEYGPTIGLAVSVACWIFAATLLYLYVQYFWKHTVKPLSAFLNRSRICKLVLQGRLSEARWGVLRRRAREASGREPMRLSKRAIVRFRGTAWQQVGAGTALLFSTVIFPLVLVCLVAYWAIGGKSEDKTHTAHKEPLAPTSVSAPQQQSGKPDNGLRKAN
ncbi:MAG: hypothetical protein EAZ43_13170 [Betaproteobacteria bacterium]|nr:MAG: hypothetical protein EAZ43_13170 [Betaproteobacteria bacterium]